MSSTSELCEGKDGQLTDEGCIKNNCRGKEKGIWSGCLAIIPKEVEGIATDIIILKENIPRRLQTTEVPITDPSGEADISKTLEKALVLVVAALWVV